MKTLTYNTIGDWSGLFGNNINTSLSDKLNNVSCILVGLDITINQHLANDLIDEGFSSPVKDGSFNKFTRIKHQKYK